MLRADPDGSILRLGDVATIRDGFVDDPVIQTFNGQRSLLVKVEKSEAEDALLIAGKIKAFLADFQPPLGANVQIWDDQTDILQQRLSLLIRNGLLGFALVFLFLVIMLDLRLATWVAMGVPISFLGAFLFFAPFGVNINMISWTDHRLGYRGGRCSCRWRERHHRARALGTKYRRHSSRRARRVQPCNHRRPDHGRLRSTTVRHRHIWAKFLRSESTGNFGLNHVAAGGVFHSSRPPISWPSME